MWRPRQITKCKTPHKTKDVLTDPPHTPPHKDISLIASTVKIAEFLAVSLVNRPSSRLMLHKLWFHCHHSDVSKSRVYYCTANTFLRLSTPNIFYSTTWQDVLWMISSYLPNFKTNVSHFLWMCPSPSPPSLFQQKWTLVSENSRFQEVSSLHSRGKHGHVHKSEVLHNIEQYRIFSSPPQMSIPQFDGHSSANPDQLVLTMTLSQTHLFSSPSSSFCPSFS